MNLNNYILSICIPTYNRLSAITDQYNFFNTNCNFFHKHKIEVIISDNASSYDIFSVFKNNHSFIKINRNDSNVGFNNNLQTAIKNSTGDYIMFLGDDDFLSINALFKVVNILLEKKPSAIISNYYIEDIYNNKKNHAIPLMKDQFGCSISDALYLFNEKITFMSSIIMKKDLINEFNTSKKKYTSKYFIHLDYLLQIDKNDQNLILNKTPLVKATNENTANYDLIDLFCDDLGGLFYHNRNVISKAAYNRFMISIFYFIFLSTWNKIKKYEVQRFIKNGFNHVLVKLLLKLAKLNIRITYIFVRILSKFSRLRISLLPIH